METQTQPLGWVNFWLPKDDWYYLRDEERRAYLAKHAEIVEQAEAKGVRRIGSYKCRGQSTWPRFDLWEFPDLETLIEMNERLEEIGHYRYFAEENIVGRRYERSVEPDGWVV